MKVRKGKISRKQEYILMPFEYRRINQKQDITNLIVFMVISLLYNLFVVWALYIFVQNSNIFCDIYIEFQKIVGFLPAKSFFIFEGIFLLFICVHMFLREVLYFNWEKRWFNNFKWLDFIYSHLYEIPQKYMNIFKYLFGLQYIYFLLSGNSQRMFLPGVFWVLFGIIYDINLISNDDRMYYYYYLKKKNMPSDDFLMSDLPIYNIDNLNSNLKAIANRLKDNLLRLTKNKTSIVAISGDWGSGKTSIVQSVIWKIMKEANNKFFICEINCTNFTKEDLLMYVNSYLDKLFFRYNVQIKFNSTIPTYIEVVLEMISEKAVKKGLDAFLNNRGLIFEDHKFQRQKYENKVQKLLRRSGRENIIFVLDDLDRTENYEVILPVIKDILSIQGITCLVLMGTHEETFFLEKYISMQYKIDKISKQPLTHYEEFYFFQYCVNHRESRLAKGVFSDLSIWSIFYEREVKEISSLLDLVIYEAFADNIYIYENAIRKYLLHLFIQYIRECKEFKNILNKDIFENDEGDILYSLIDIVKLAKNLIENSFDEITIKSKLEDCESNIIGSIVVHSDNAILEQAFLLAKSLGRNMYERSKEQIEHILSFLVVYNDLLMGIDEVNNQLRKNKELWRTSIYTGNKYLELLFNYIYKDKQEKRNEIEKIIYTVIAFDTYKWSYPYPYVEVDLNRYEIEERGVYVVRINKYLDEKHQLKKCTYDYVCVSEHDFIQNYKMYNSDVSQYIRNMLTRPQKNIESVSIVDLLSQ